MQWMEASSRFTAFVETYRDKIRKKIRVARQPESVLDLRGELEVAYCLLNDRRLAVAYEPYASAKRRGPDFAVTYRTNLVFNIEVARIRVAESELGGIELPRKAERIVRILLDKLGQMQPGMANLLVIHTREELARSIDLRYAEVSRLPDRTRPRGISAFAIFNKSSSLRRSASGMKCAFNVRGSLIRTIAPLSFPLYFCRSSSVFRSRYTGSPRTVPFVDGDQALG